MIQTLRTRPVLLALVLLALLALLSGAVFAVGLLTGFGFTKGDVYLQLPLGSARKDDALPALHEADLPVQGEMRDGLSIVLEKVVMYTDRTILQVSLDFENPAIWLNAPWNVTMTDAEGQVYPLTDISPDTLDVGRTHLYQTVPLGGDKRITLSLTSFPYEGEVPAFVDFSADPAIFTFDPGQGPQVGQNWTLDENIQVGSFDLHLVGARMAAPGEFLFEFEPTENVTGVMLYSALASGAPGGVPAAGNFTAGMTFSQMPNEPFEVQIRSVYYGAHGPWEVEWQIPAAVAVDSATMTPAPSPTPLAIPTLLSQDPLLLEVRSLSEKFDHVIVQGPAWVHVISENISAHLEPGQTYPPPYYLDEQWNEIDAEGWVTRNLTTHSDANGHILQRSASFGTKSVNFTTGEAFEISPYHLSFDLFAQDLDYALSHPGPTGSAGAGGEQVTREEATCEDGSPCLLITVINPVVNRKIWINVQTGQQVQFQSFQRSADGSEQLQFTQRFVLVERLPSPPQEVVDILARVLTP